MYMNLAVRRLLRYAKNAILYAEYARMEYTIES